MPSLEEHYTQQGATLLEGKEEKKNQILTPIRGTMALPTLIIDFLPPEH
jgi:hypothetical protein